VWQVFVYIIYNHVGITLSVCVRSNFQSLDVESSFLICWNTLGICRSSSYIKVIGSRSRLPEQKHLRVVSLRLKDYLVTKCHLSLCHSCFVFCIMVGCVCLFLCVFFCIFKSFCIRFYDIALWCKFHTGILNNMDSGCVKHMKILLGYSKYDGVSSVLLHLGQWTPTSYELYMMPGLTF